MIKWNHLPIGIFLTYTKFLSQKKFLGRETINDNGYAEVTIDLKPDLRIDEIEKKLSDKNSKLTLTNLLRKTLKLSNVAVGLIMEFRSKKQITNFEIKRLAYIIKSYKIILTKPFAISNNK